MAVIDDVDGIEGLSLRTEALSAEAAARIVRALQSEEWAAWRRWRPFSRQDFGYEYQLGSRGVKPAPPIPPEIRALFPALRRAGWRGREDPTQVIVTRYPVGGSLRQHIDSPVFGEQIAGVSLEAEWPICFAPRWRRRDEKVLPLPVRSAYVMRGPARWQWMHRVPENDFGGERISLTFRTIARKPGGER